MRTERQASRQFSDSNTELISGLLFTFIGLTIIAALFHLFGLDWFAANADFPDPSKPTQKVIKVFLKTLELVFMYKMTTKKKFGVCTLIGVLHTASVGFIPVGLLQPTVDLLLILAVPFMLRKDRLRALLDCLGMYSVLMLYTSLFMLAKFGGIYPEYSYSFYANVVSLVDYKLFIITLYLYTAKKGGLHLWRIKLIS